MDPSWQSVRDSAEAALRELATWITAHEPQVAAAIGSRGNASELFCELALRRSSWEGEALEIVLATVGGTQVSDRRLVVECDFSDGSGGPLFASHTIRVTDSGAATIRSALQAIAAAREELTARRDDILAVVRLGPVPHAN